MGVRFAKLIPVPPFLLALNPRRSGAERTTRRQRTCLAERKGEGYDVPTVRYLGIFMLACSCAVVLSCANRNLEEKMNNETERVIRSALGADRWFPGSSDRLKKMVRGFIDEADTPKVEGRIVGCLAPHAGYDYSGKVAGHTFRALRENAASAGMPETVVVLGFSHRGGSRGLALMDGDAIQTPMGTTELDKSAAELLTRDNEKIHMDYAPHACEHSAENEIPFVQATFPEAKLVVALFGGHDADTVIEVAGALGALAKTKKIVVVASTDMLHDADYDLVSRVDRETLKKVEAMDSNAIIKEWKPNRQIFCGLMPVLTVMRFASAQGCKAGSVLHYRNSGDDDPSGRGRWVVGYGAVVFAVK